jgi:hypothetical protein
MDQIQSLPKRRVLALSGALRMVLFIESTAWHANTSF